MSDEFLLSAILVILGSLGIAVVGVSGYHVVVCRRRQWRERR